MPIKNILQRYPFDSTYPKKITLGVTPLGWGRDAGRDVIGSVITSILGRQFVNRSH
jgi:hypothetical protein